MRVSIPVRDDAGEVQCEAERVLNDAFSMGNVVPNWVNDREPAGLRLTGHRWMGFQNPPNISAMYSKPSLMADAIKFATTERMIELFAIAESTGVFGLRNSIRASQ